MGLTSNEVQEWAAQANAGGLMDRLHDSLVHRAANGDPTAQFALAKNFEEALAAAEKHSTRETFIRVNPHAFARVGRDSAKLPALTLEVSGSGNVHVRGIAQSFQKQSIGHRSFEFCMTTEDAIELARAILKETNANP